MEFCGRLPLKIWEQRKQAKSHLKRYLTRFLNDGYLKNYAFEFERTQERWYVRFYPGSKALEELETISGQQTLFDQIEPQVKEVEYQESKNRMETANKILKTEEAKRLER